METPSGERWSGLSLSPGTGGYNLREGILWGGGKPKVKKKYAYYTYIFTVNFSNQNINKNSFK